MLSKASQTVISDKSSLLWANSVPPICSKSSAKIELISLGVDSGESTVLAICHLKNYTLINVIIFINLG